MVAQQTRPGPTLVPTPRPRRHRRVTDRATRAAALAVLRRLRHGELHLVDGVDRHRFGRATAACPLSAPVTVHRPAFYRAMLTGGTRPLPLTYIDRDCDTDHPLALT